MVLADTSVWISHLREGNAGLKTLLDNAHVVCHPFIIGELACGNMKNRSEILSLLHVLPMITHAEHEERFLPPWWHRLPACGDRRFKIIY